MNQEDKVEIILATINHKNGKDQKINTLWVGSMAMAGLSEILGGSYGTTNYKAELKTALRKGGAGSMEGFAKIDRAFEYLLHYTIHMGTLEEFYRHKFELEKESD